MCATIKKIVVGVIIRDPQRIPIHYIHKKTKNGTKNCLTYIIARMCVCVYV